MAIRFPKWGKAVADTSMMIISVAEEMIGIAKHGKDALLTEFFARQMAVVRYFYMVDEDIENYTVEIELYHMLCFAVVSTYNKPGVFKAINDLDPSLLRKHFKTFEAIRDINYLVAGKKRAKQDFQDRLFNINERGFNLVSEIVRATPEHLRPGVLAHLEEHGEGYLDQIAAYKEDEEAREKACAIAHVFKYEFDA